MAVELSLARATPLLWLHGNGLTVTNAYLLERGRQVLAKPPNGEEEFLGFDFGQPVGPGKVRLCVGYRGTMSHKDSSGLFRRKEGDQWYAATQFEATWAFLSGSGEDRHAGNSVSGGPFPFLRQTPAKPR